MTLNITVAARWLMAQSSDFRLTSSGVVVDEAAQKQVVLQYMSWSGLVCYTGVARFDSHDTAAWLAQVLSHELGQRSQQEVVNRLIEQGSVWLRQAPAPRWHTFTVITYEKGKPCVYVISNYERPNGPQLTTPADALFCTRVRPRGPRCIVTGCAPAVTSGQRSRLEDLLAAVPTPEHLREEIARTSRESSANASGTVGDSCVVAHLCPDGSGQAQLFGNLYKEFLPAMITNGHNVATSIPTVIAEEGSPGPRRLVGATWSANGEVTVMTGAYRALSEQTGSGWTSSGADGDK
ncbi:hypothetical protein [Streptomyces sp.]|uniref:hypothetical protein n=1 Tax=Streptomyces sp. TaxID=1931 RepID=UPI002D792B3D|nr:hypothetical protein [Streptomyces sp.]HET6354665.1 hypothetical protein [Streptomyces sp.]